MPATSPLRSDPELLVLHAVRLLGLASPTAAARRFGLDVEDAAELLLDAEARGWVSHTSFAGTAGWSLTERGRARDEELLAAELGDRAAQVRGVHETFVPLNAGFQGAMTRWQLRPLPGDQLATNDHADHRWDDRVLADLRSCVLRVVPLCQELAAGIARMSGYDQRLHDALARAEAGQRSAVDGLRGQSRGGDSLHTVWFELHEDLLSTLGLAR